MEIKAGLLVSNQGNNIQAIIDVGEVRLA